MIAHFIFKPYSRNFWHYHPDAEQTLLVLDGEGYYQEEGGEKRVIRKGDVIVTPLMYAIGMGRHRVALSCV